MLGHWLRATGSGSEPGGEVVSLRTRQALLIRSKYKYVDVGTLDEAGWLGCAGSITSLEEYAARHSVAVVFIHKQKGTNTSISYYIPSSKNNEHASGSIDNGWWRHR